MASGCEHGSTPERPTDELAKQGRETEADSAFFFETSPAPGCILDPAGTILRCNPAWTMLVGSNGHGNGADWLAAHHPDCQAALSEALSAAAGGTRPEPVVVRLGDAAGADRWLEWRFALPASDRGSIAASARDLTDLQRERFMAEAFDAGRCTAAIECDPADGRVRWSFGLETLFNRAESGIPVNVSGLVAAFPTRDGGLLTRLIGQLCQGEAVGETENVTTSAGYPLKLAGAAVSVRGRAERVFIGLREAGDPSLRRLWRDRLGAAAMHASSGVILLDRDLRVDWINPAYERLSGYSLNEVIGRTALDLQQDDVEVRLRSQAIDAQLRAGEPVHGQLCKTRRDGSIYWIDLSIAPVRGDDGTISGYVAVETDITQIREYALRMEALEAEARASHERLLQAMEVLPDAFALFDAQDRLVMFNQRYREFFSRIESVIRPGVQFEELLNHSLANAQFPDVVGNEKAFFEKRMAGRGVGNGTLELNLPDGRVLQTMERRTPTGELVAFHRDITDLRRQERAASAARNTLESTLEAIPDLLFELDLSGHFHDARNGSSSQLEHPQEWYIGRHMSATLPDHACRRIDQALRQCLDDHNAGRAGQAPPFDVHDDKRWFSVCVALKSPGNDPRFVVIARDITERKHDESARIEHQKKLEHALAERDAAQKRFEDIARVSSDWFWETDGLHRFTYLSESFAAVDRRPTVAFLGRTLNEMIGRDADPTVRTQLARYQAILNSHQPFRDVLCMIPRPGGNPAWIQLNGAPVFDGTGKFVGYRGSGSDVTALHEARIRAEAANAAKSQFLANMSHEIRTPLNGIMGMAEILEESVQHPEARELLGIIRTSGATLTRILNDILDFSKIEAGLLDLEIAPFIPADIAGRVESLHRLPAEAKGLDFSVTFTASAQRPRMGDEHRVLQVLHNLVGNAVKFTERGHVSVAFRCSNPDALEIVVADSGIGLTPEERSRVFDEFVQADSSIGRRFGGTGLGLSISRRLVALMGGEIDFQSASGQGTSVALKLPLPRSGLRPAVPSATGPPRLPAGLRALVADDNATNRLLMARFLERLQVFHEICDGGTAAVAAARMQRFDLLLLDISMPDLTGPEALALIHAEDRARGLSPVPAVAVTANAMRHQVQEYLAEGFAAHVPKPVQIDMLAETIAAVVAGDPPGAASSPTRLGNGQ